MYKIILLSYIYSTIASNMEIDPLGYLAYCPCMGRFGNQADHFLGALAFAKRLNRTLILPPWVEYRQGEKHSRQIPFDTYFKVEPLRAYHKVILMEEFMEKIAPIEWPINKRISFCYMPRGGSTECKAKEGNPFGPFWDHFHIDFVDSEFYQPLHYDFTQPRMEFDWKHRYPATEYPVLAFTGAPASFPVTKPNTKLAKYLEWSDNIDMAAERFKKSLPKGGFIGIHLRNGIDWVKACQHIPDSPNLFSAPQCLGYHNEYGRATSQMCLPSKEIILRQLKRVIKSLDKSKVVKTVFVASDNNHMISELEIGLKRLKLAVVKLNDTMPHLDLAILGRSNHFIGNCISSFSAFVKRERDVKGFPTSFWGFPPERTRNMKDEL